MSICNKTLLVGHKRRRGGKNKKLMAILAKGVLRKLVIQESSLGRFSRRRHLLQETVLLPPILTEPAESAYLSEQLLSYSVKLHTNSTLLYIIFFVA